MLQEYWTTWYTVNFFPLFAELYDVLCIYTNINMYIGTGTRDLPSKVRWLFLKTLTVISIIPTASAWWLHAKMCPKKWVIIRNALKPRGWSLGRSPRRYYIDNCLQKIRWTIQTDLNLENDFYWTSRKKYLLNLLMYEDDNLQSISQGNDSRIMSPF